MHFRVEFRYPEYELDNRNPSLPSLQFARDQLQSAERATRAAESEVAAAVNSE